MTTTVNIQHVANLHISGGGVARVDVGPEGMSLAQFLESANVNYASSSEKGTSYASRTGRTLGPNDLIYPGETVVAVANRSNG